MYTIKQLGVTSNKIQMIFKLKIKANLYAEVSASVE